MTEQEQFEKIKDACLSEGGKLLIQDLEANRNASDTINVPPLIDPQTGVMLSSQTDQMLKQQGYVAALNWVIGIMEHYQTQQFEDNNG